MKRKIVVYDFIIKGAVDNLTCYGDSISDRLTIGHCCEVCNKKFECWTSGEDEIFEIKARRPDGLRDFDLRLQVIETGALTGVSPVNVAEFVLFGDKALTVHRGVWDLGIVNYSWKEKE